MRVGIIGAGHIAEKTAYTLLRMSDMTCGAVASRSLVKAEAFASKYSIPKAYGSYEELLDDPEVDLAYIALPHSLHFGITKRALLKGKPCLVEKPFMLNAAQAKEIFRISEEKGVFVAEAIYTRYLPAVGIIRRDIGSGIIGQPRTISATLSYEMSAKERILSPELGGGALLDLGIYGINFVRAYSDSPIVKVSSLCTKFPTGPDMSDSISFALEDGTVANVLTSAVCQGDNVGVIAGTKANLWMDDVNNPKLIRIYAKHHELLDEHTVPSQISGFEYELRACKDAISEGKTEPSQMPHKETLNVMEIMDSLRKEWGVAFPGE